MISFTLLAVNLRETALAASVVNMLLFFSQSTALELKLY